MSIVNGLALDHFYFGLTEKQFQDLKTIFTPLNGIDHSVKKSGDDTWEGLYFRTRIGSYIEFLRDSRIDSFGLAISGFKSQYINPMLIREEFPTYPWQTGERFWENGTPWFDWLSQVDTSAETIHYFYTWIMKYHSSHIISDKPPARRLIDSTCRVEIASHPSMIELIQAQEFWLPGRFSLNNDSKGGLLLIRDKDATEIEFSILFDESVTGFKFQNMQLRLARGQTIKNTKNDTWEVISENQILKLILNSHL